MKGIVLAGGMGTRLYPITIAVSKQLLPVYNKPMIYYPIATLMELGIRDILIITNPKDLPLFETLLGDGDKYGCSFQYIIQDKPRGIADAFIVAEEFIAKDSVALILGDNIFHGNGLSDINIDKLENNSGLIFAYRVNNPNRYGVVEFDADGNAISIEEKPKNPKSQYAVPGIYFYSNNVINIAKSIEPSDRGELEITDVNNHYLKAGKLKVQTLDEGTAWLDTGTFSSLMQAGQFVQVLEERQGIRIGSLEDAAYKKGYINIEQYNKLISK
ncbi:MAG: glucose-1-phosphate thymidylyltransferase RfbA [Flavobacteriaceae bacterium]|nr:glucose-1-phosphate thymidylyltransferase RfbA [Flavobacteriaceae bacterium]